MDSVRDNCDVWKIKKLFYTTFENFVEISWFKKSTLPLCETNMIINIFQLILVEWKNCATVPLGIWIFEMNLKTRKY